MRTGDAGAAGRCVRGAGAAERRMLGAGTVGRGVVGGRVAEEHEGSGGAE